MTSPQGTQAARVPFGSHRFRYAPGTIRPSVPQRQQDDAVLVRHREWKSAFLRLDGRTGWRMVHSPDADHPYVAEGQGFGLLAAVLTAGADPEAQTIFDGILAFVLAHPSAGDPDLLAAEIDDRLRPASGGDSATDGDLDVAYALLLADAQWGGGTYDYRDLALRRLAGIRRREINPRTGLMLLGDWSDEDDKRLYYASRTSDWMTGHFRAFARTTGDPAWEEIRRTHQTLITWMQATYAPDTGLLPDFVEDTHTSTPRPAQGELLESRHDGHYGWNACRDPLRLGADALTSGDPAVLESTRRMNAWIRASSGADPERIGSGYRLDGRAFSGHTEVAFIAPFAVSAMTDPTGQTWLDALWERLAGTAVDPDSYYGSTLQLLAMLMASGNFWTP